MWYWALKQLNYNVRLDILIEPDSFLGFTVIISFDDHNVHLYATQTSLFKEKIKYSIGLYGNCILIYLYKLKENFTLQKLF